MNSQILEPLPFGKHKGRTLSQLMAGSVGERGYVEWMAREFSNEVWRRAAEDAVANAAQAIVPERFHYTIGVVTDTRASLVCAYDQRIVTLLRDRVDGINWNRKEQRWEFPTAQLAAVKALLSSVGTVEMSEAAEQAMTYHIDRRARLDSIRVTHDTDMEIPTVLPLFGFQRVGVEFALEAGGRALIADEMGLGKTSQAIGTALMLRAKHGARRILTVCPASLKINWYREWIRFGGLEPTIWHGQKRIGDLEADVHIINYDIFAKFRTELEQLNFDLILIDEAHYLKNKDALRSIAVFGGYNKRERVRVKPFATRFAVLLTGTPVLNRPGELFPLLHYLAPERFADWFTYANRYGAWAPMNMEGRPSKPQNLDELHERTKDIVIRRKKVDVLKDLPPKLVSDVFVELSTEQRKTYRKTLITVAEEWKAAAKDKQKPTLNELQILTTFLNEVKLDKVRELVGELQNEDDVRSVLVFCTRLGPLKQLREQYKQQAIYIDGSMTPEQRQAEVDRFQRGDATIALLSLRAAGVGLTLTKADTVIFIDQDFVPANHQQAEDRAHRIGQVNPVQIYYLLAEDTIDEDLRALLAEKVAITSQIADGEVRQLERQRSVFTDFVRRLKARYKQFASLADPDDVQYTEAA
jgi:SWI/SNF-related matrix-associated actin-dependent regulator 1 of chromatin subfamily A